MNQPISRISALLSAALPTLLVTPPMHHTRAGLALFAAVTYSATYPMPVSMVMALVAAS
jgi:hypothetical protein